MPAKQTTAMLGQQRQQQARWGRAAPVPARSHASSVHRDPVSDIHGEGDVPAKALGMSVNWWVDDPATEADERMALGQARGPLREPGPDDPAGTEDETGEP